MRIAVLSGKGGTGKTTVSASLAASVSSCQYVDCDVEEPNGALFLNPKIEHITPVCVLVPEVDETKCDGCGVRESMPFQRDCRRQRQSSYLPRSLPPLWRLCDCLPAESDLRNTKGNRCCGNGRRRTFYARQAEYRGADHDTHLT